MAAQAGILLAIVFFGLLFFSIPISICIIAASFVTLTSLLTVDFGVFVSAQKLITGMDSFTLLAVPFFILAGLFMSNGGIAQKLINLAQVFVGRIPGSLALANIAGNAMFGSISGSGIAAATAIGGVLGPIEKENGYDEAYSAAVNIATAPVGQLIPPTAAFIVYSLASGGTSIAALFIAGWVPGLLWAFACGVVAWAYAKKHNYVAKSSGFNAKEAVRAFIDAIPSLFLIVIIIGGITGGIFTATEAAGVAVAYTFILSVFFYRTIKVSDIPKLLTETAVMTSVIMLIIGASSVMSFVMSFTGIPTAISSMILGISDNPIVILIIINILLLIVGTFMDVAPALLIFTPILLPIAIKCGMDPVQFGVMIVFNLAVGTITPPVGSVLFVGASIANLEIEDVIKKLVPYFVAILIVLLMVTFIPGISVWLPKAFDLM
ncbi:TRAP transporter large permease subunit [Clostridium bovifaecis]|uniref:TRAP transporter large permease subunit n=1 Tax=Clostridium bovifaecis TaxID=2184719 RepID=A0A6I6EVF1_9CLOT|nr:TRAP transporter large permease subunit [Clostridium bovifaecis]